MSAASVKRPRTKKRPSEDSPEVKCSLSPPSDPMVGGSSAGGAKCVNSDCSRERPPLRVFCDVCLRKSQQKYGGAPDERLWAIKRVSQEQSKIDPMFCDYMKQSDTGHTIFDFPFTSFVILFGAVEKIVSDRDHEVMRRPVTPKVVLKDSFGRQVSDPYLEANHGLFAFFFDATKYAWPLQLEYADSVTDDQLYRLLELDDIFTERLQINLTNESLRNVGRLCVPTVFAKTDELRARFRLAAEMLSKVKEVARELENVSETILDGRRHVGDEKESNPSSVLDELDRRMWRMVLNDCKNELQSAIASKHKLNCLRELLVATSSPNTLELQLSGYEAEGAAPTKVTSGALKDVMLKIACDRPCYVYVFQEDEDVTLLTDDALQEPNCAPGDELLCCPVGVVDNALLSSVTFHAFAFLEPLDALCPSLLFGFRAINLRNIEPVTSKSSLANVAIEGKAHAKLAIAMATPDAFAAAAAAALASAAAAANVASA